MADEQPELQPAPPADESASPESDSNAAPASEPVKIEAAVALAIMTSGPEKVLASPDIQVTDRGITFLCALPWNRYFQLLTVWHRIGHIWHLGLADIFRQGRLQFGDLEVAKAVEQLEFDLSDATRGYTIGALTPEVREMGLTSEHLFVLGKSLDSEKDQEKWGALAVTEKLSGAELKKSIEAGKVIHQTEVNATSGRGSGIPNVQGLNLWFGRWIKQVGGEAVVMRWGPDLKRAWLAEVKDIVDLALRLEQSLGPDPSAKLDAPGAPAVTT